jgi:hypothetical protein
MRRFIPVGSALALAAVALTAPSLPQASAAPAPAASGKVATAYAFNAGGYGTRVKGGQLPASSGSTAYQSIGCTNMAGINRENAIADVEIPGLGTVSGIRTDVSTTQTPSETAVVSEHKIARIVLAETALGKLSIGGLTSYAKAFATPGGGFDAESKTTVATLRFEPAGGGAPMELALPTPGRPIEVPGLLKISIGEHRERTGGDFARARSDALFIKLIPTDTKVVVGHTKAQISRGVKDGLFAGSANTTATELVNGIAKTGRTQLVQMPCQGTEGKVQTNEAVGLTIPGVLSVGAVRSSQMGQNLPHRSLGFEESSVASVNLGNGALVVDAVKGRVNVVRGKGAGKKPDVTFDGSTVAGITVDGQVYTLPELDGLEIPGIAKIETMVQERVKNGGRITALRLTLLDGTGGIVNIGQASLKIRPSGR